VILQSQYREFLNPFVQFLRELEQRHPDRDIARI
jgi:hypothetical protein